MSRTNGWRVVLSVVAMVAVLAVSQQAMATSYYWDNNSSTAGVGGKGIWDLNNTANWSTSSAGTVATTQWTTAMNDGTNNALLGGSASIVYPVTLSSPVNVGILEFTIASGTGTVTINDSGSNSITLYGTGGASGTDPNLWLNPYSSATINTVIADSGGCGLRYNTSDSFGGNYNTGRILTLTRANTYTGPTQLINAGAYFTLDFTAAGAPTNNIINSSSPLVMGLNSYLQMKGNASVAGKQTFNGTTLVPGISHVILTNTVAILDNLELGGFTRNAGSVVDFTIPAAANGLIKTSTANANLPGGQQTILGGWATVNSGNDWAASGSGATPGAIAALGSYSATWTAGKDVSPTAATTTTPATINSLRWNAAGGASVTLSQDLVIATGGILETQNSGTGTNFTINGNYNLTSANGQDLILADYNWHAHTTTINANITDCGTGADKMVGLTLKNASVSNLTLGGNNSYTGPTYILLNASTGTTGGVIVTSNTGLGTADCGTFLVGSYTGSTANAAGWLSFQNVSCAEPLFIAPYSGGSTNIPTIRSTGTTTLSGNITAQGVVNGNLCIGAAAGSQLTLSGNISGGASSQSLTLNNPDADVSTYSGTVTLSGNNSYAGGLYFYSGTLIATGSSALNSFASLNIGRNGGAYVSGGPVGELDLQAGGGSITLPQTQANMFMSGNIRNVSGTNTLTNGFKAAGNFSTGGTGGGLVSTQLGSMTVFADCGTLTIGSGSNGILDAFDLGFAHAGSVWSVHTLQLAGTGGAGIVNGPIANNAAGGPLDVNVSGGATWTFGAANTYKGATAVAGGSLQVKNATGLGVNSGASGEMLALNQTAGATVSGSGTLDLYGITTNYPISLNGGSLINSNASTGSVLSAPGAVIGVVATSGGSGYSAVPTVIFTGSNTTPATATAKLGLTSASLAIATGGTNYQVGDIVGVNCATDTGSYATFKVTGVTAGAITSWTLLDPGAGFLGDSSTFTVANARGGTSATVTADLTKFQVSMIQMTQVGAGYAAAPAISFSSGAATGTAWLNAGVYLQGTSNNIGGTGHIIVNPVITGNGGFTKIGTDNLTLKAVNNYTGPTGISGGLLTLGCNYAVPSTSAVTLTGGALAMNGYTDCVTSLALSGGNVTGLGTLVVQGGKLSGVGSISPVLKLLGGANLSPGFSPGSVTLGRASFGSAADNYTVDINGTGVANYDNVLYKVAMTLNSASLVINDLNYAASAAINDKFFIMDSDNGATGARVSGTFNGLAQGATVYGTSGIGYTVNYNLGGDPRGTSSDVALTTLSLPAVPEPATLFLVGTGALGVAAFIRRQRMK